MAPNFSKDAILQGSVDNFCLICETYLLSEEETFEHISNISHKKKLSTIQYIDDFKEDGIKKINGKYFCELCNKLLPVLARVRLHILDLTHIDKKSSFILKRKNSLVIAFDQFVINEQSWHGLHENSCALCNLEYEDEELHKIEAYHILNLIQNKVEFDLNKNIYRKVDDVSFQCLTCNSILALHNLPSHFNEADHKSNYQICCEAYHKLKDVPTKKSNKSKVFDENIKAEDKYEKKCDLNKKKKLTKDVDTIEEKLESSKINKALQSTTENKDVSKNTADISKNEENFSKNKNNHVDLVNFQYVYDEKSEDNICKMLNTKDYVTRDENGRTWCILCNWNMEPHKIIEHVEGQHHQTILTLHKERAERLKNFYKPKGNMCSKNSTGKNDMLLNSIDTFQKNGININLESNSATCKKCTIALEYDFEAISQHITGHNNSIPAKEKRKPAEFPSGTDKLADRKNSLFTSPVHLKRDPEDNIIEIDGKIDLTLKINPESLEDKSLTHVPKQANSKKSQIVKLELKKPKKIVLSKVPLLVYIKNLTAVENNIFKDIIVNEKFVLNFLSFCYIAHEKQVYKCILCEEFMTFNNILDHTQAPHHDRAINESLVITQVDSEFIREVTPGKFHCGFCNIVKATWDEMLEHLETSSHKESKNSANWRLMQYEPQLANERIQRQFQETLFLEMFHRFF